jgi:hypothetical protein
MTKIGKTFSKEEREQTESYNRLLARGTEWLINFCGIALVLSFLGQMNAKILISGRPNLSENKSELQQALNLREGVTYISAIAAHSGAMR